MIQMNDRERLIGLIKEGMNKHESTVENYVQPVSKFVADYLLEHGVIVPPCKVGNVVYVKPKTWSGLSFINYDHCFIHSEHFLAAEVVSIIKTRKQNLIKLKVYHRATCTAEYKRYPVSSIGKTVFLTREEAEKSIERGMRYETM